MDMSEIINAYLEGLGRWKGCHWPTDFGAGKLNLNGLKSSQAALMAGATSGRERADWRAAASWLKQVEEDAIEAEKDAKVAADLASSGDLAGAKERAELACQLESRYTADKTWRPLLTAIAKHIDAGQHNACPH